MIPDDKYFDAVLLSTGYRNETIEMRFVVFTPDGNEYVLVRLPSEAC